MLLSVRKLLEVQQECVERRMQKQRSEAKSHSLKETKMMYILRASPVNAQNILQKLEILTRSMPTRGNG